jgi:hypothetical protein
MSAYRTAPYLEIARAQKCVACGGREFFSVGVGRTIACRFCPGGEWDHKALSATRQPKE